MGAIAALGARAVESTGEGFQPVLHVAIAARVEWRLAGDTAGAPVLADAIGRPNAELAIDLLVRHSAQRVLVDDRDLAPLLRIVEALEADLLEPRPPERGAQRLLHRRALALR